MTTVRATDTLAADFVEFSIEAGVLRFGEFKTKAGRLSPYFFDTGLFNDGTKLGRLGQFYARRLVASGLSFDMLFGPAYKGITLAAAVAIELARLGQNRPFTYNRKEEKKHGEGGTLVGAALAGRVVIVDDVVSDGASKSEAARVIRAGGAEPVAVVIAMDRQERAGDASNDHRSGVQFVVQELGLEVIAVATLTDLLQYLRTTNDPVLRAHRERVIGYRERYGV